MTVFSVNCWLSLNVGKVPKLEVLLYWNFYHLSHMIQYRLSYTLVVVIVIYIKSCPSNNKGKVIPYL